ncbi:hypothetical protein [Pseudonocardia acaciae]|uniref:hypothetical protein n=1 Tax=Pseudonocardia acaciae TaxID=551276 RepID=UPI000491374E|nr:hypothetical protein [Pseudonocardia acaciae]
MARTPASSLQSALSCWDTARRQVARGNRVRAGLTYQEGLNYFVLCANLTWRAEARSTTAPRPAGLMPVFHAIGAMGREGVPVMERCGGTRAARRHARTTLAASHLADPTGGRAELINEALAAETGSPRLDLNGDGPLSVEARIAGAAQARLLLATLMVERPDVPRRPGRPQPVGIRGSVFPGTEIGRFRRAVLPSCMELAADDEMRQLARESVDMYTELCRAVAGHESALDRAKEILARARG